MTPRSSAWTAALAATSALSIALVALHATAGSHDRPAIRESFRNSVPGLVQPVTLLAGSGSGGKIAEVCVRQGEAVRKGQVLARFDTTELLQRRDESRKALQSIESALEGGEVMDRIPKDLRAYAFESHPDIMSAENAYVNALESFQSASPDQRTAASAGLDRAAGERTRVRQRIGRILGRGSAKTELTSLAGMIRKTISAMNDAVGQSEVRSPSDAKVDLLHVNIGERLPPGSPLAVLLVTGEYFSDIVLPDAEIERIAGGVPLRGRFVQSGSPFAWRVESISRRKVPIPFREKREIAEETVVRARISSVAPLVTGAAAEFQVP